MNQNQWFNVTSIWPIPTLLPHGFCFYCTCGRYLQVVYLKCSLVQASGCDGQERHQRDKGPTDPYEDPASYQTDSKSSTTNPLNVQNQRFGIATHLEVRCPKSLKDKESSTSQKIHSQLMARNVVFHEFSVLGLSVSVPFACLIGFRIQSSCFAEQRLSSWDWMYKFGYLRWTVSLIPQMDCFSDSYM